MKKLSELNYNIRKRKRHRKDPRVRLRDSARVRAIVRNLDWDLHTYKDVPKCPKLCPILGIPLFVGRRKSTDNSPTLDRIDNNKGYTKDNIHIISRKANAMKSNASFKEIEKLYNYMKDNKYA